MCKSIRIKSKVRFTIFVVIMLFAITGITNSAMGFFESYGAEQIEYTTVQVNYGDTLWTIADQYMPDDMDTRKAVSIIEKTNNIDNDIQPGMTLKIPVMS